MTAVESNIQKLEALLKSATNARQRQMYQSLLDKARQDALHQKSALNSSQVADSKVDEEQRVRATSSTKKKKQSKPLAKEMLSVADALIPETKSKASSGDRPSEPKQVAANKVPRNKSNQQSKSDKPTIFQAVGLIKCTPEIKEDKLYVTIDNQAYELEKGERRSGKYFDELKTEIEQNGSREMWLRVYPKIFHNPKNQEISYWFTLIKAFARKSQCKDQQEGFIFRGIWQYVSFCSEPVISIHRNINNLNYYLRLPPVAKKAFTRLNAFPVIWYAPVEPSRYNPELDYDQQMPRYFVQVRAVFEDGQFEVIEEIEKPTLEIPRYIKPQKKDTKPKPENL